MYLQQGLGVSCISITHDLSAVEHVSDDVAVMYRGAIVELDGTDRVMNWPQRAYTKALLGAVPSLTPPNCKGETLAQSQR